VARAPKGGHRGPPATIEFPSGRHHHGANGARLRSATRTVEPKGGSTVTLLFWAPSWPSVPGSDHAAPLPVVLGADGIESEQRGPIWALNAVRSSDESACDVPTSRVAQRVRHRHGALPRARNAPNPAAARSSRVHRQWRARHHDDSNRVAAHQSCSSSTLSEEVRTNVHCSPCHRTPTPTCLRACRSIVTPTVSATRAAVDLSRALALRDRDGVRRFIRARRTQECSSLPPLHELAIALDDQRHQEFGPHPSMIIGASPLGPSR
jgi:hypothetical protein